MTLLLRGFCKPCRYLQPLHQHISQSISSPPNPSLHRQNHEFYIPNKLKYFNLIRLGQGYGISTSSRMRKRKNVMISWIDLYLPENIRPYAHLARLVKPIGTWLLAWPFVMICRSITLAASPGHLPDMKMFTLFVTFAVRFDYGINSNSFFCQPNKYHATYHPLFLSNFIIHAYYGGHTDVYKPFGGLACFQVQALAVEASRQKRAAKEKVVACATVCTIPALSLAVAHYHRQCYFPPPSALLACYPPSPPALLLHQPQWFVCHSATSPNKVESDSEVTKDPLGRLENMQTSDSQTVVFL
ncbi:hypothetical protein LXL04_006011 [Taraxacum kok-saghyz]